MRTNPILAFLAGVSAAAVLFAAAPASATQAAETATPASGGAPAGAGAALSKADQKILLDMAHGSMAEIEMGKMAQGKSRNKQVTTYAQQMIDDHTAALGAVFQLAAARGLSMPADLDRARKAMIGKLDAKSGGAFDKAYMAQGGVADHKKMHSMLVNAEKKARDPDLKALAAKILPTVDQHLKAARQMDRQKGLTNAEKPSAATDAGR